MINLILFLVQNVALDAICNNTFHNILFCPVSQIGNQSLIGCSLKNNFIIEKPFMTANFTAITASVIHHI